MGRLVSPRVGLDEAIPERRGGSGSAGGDWPLQALTLTFDYWQPLCASTRKPEAVKPLCLPVCAAFRESAFKLQLIGLGLGGGAFALPTCHEFSGRAAAAAVATQIQKLQYIREQQQRYTESHLDSANRHPLAWSLPEYTVDTGAQACLLQACTRGWMCLHGARVVPCGGGALAAPTGVGQL